MKVQLNHPGSQKPFKLGNGYQIIGNKIIRDWNSDPVHYRKFIQNRGFYVDNLDSQPKEGMLCFWGEWEGHSEFCPFQNVSSPTLPNGVHKPFHSTTNRGIQNTDPYVFGDYFKYCFCKQRGQLLNLQTDDLILFGTVSRKLNRFYIDTVFVVKDYDLSSIVQRTNGSQYTQTYREQTLEQLNAYLKQPTVKNNHKVYHSKTWWDDKNYFSFVPCKPCEDGDKGFDRLYIDLNNNKYGLSSNPTGVSYLERCSLTEKQLWQDIVDIAISRGFKLGIWFEEP